MHVFVMLGVQEILTNGKHFNPFLTIMKRRKLMEKLGFYEHLQTVVRH